MENSNGGLYKHLSLQLDLLHHQDSSVAICMSTWTYMHYTGLLLLTCNGYIYFKLSCYG